MPTFQIIQCDIDNEVISGSYESLEMAKCAWDELIAKRDVMNYISMELINDELEVIETYYWR